MKRFAAAAAAAAAPNPAFYRRKGRIPFGKMVLDAKEKDEDSGFSQGSRMTLDFRRKMGSAALFSSLLFSSWRV